MKEFCHFVCAVFTDFTFYLDLALKAAGATLAAPPNPRGFAIINGGHGTVRTSTPLADVSAAHLNTAEVQ